MRDCKKELPVFKLCACAGPAGSSLLNSYEIERRGSALRNTNYARGFAESVGNFIPEPGLEAEDASGADLRNVAGAYLEDHARREFNIPGITFGAR